MSRRGWVLFVALGIIWGLPYLFIKVAVEHLAPPVVVFGRVTLGAALLLPLAWRRGALRPLRPVAGWVAVFAAVEIAIPWVLVTYSETRVTSSLAALFIASVPLVGAVMAHLMRLDDRFDRSRIAGLALGVAGVGLLVGFDVRGDSWLAVAALAVSAVGYAWGPIIVSQRLAGVPSLGVIAISFAATSLAYAPFAAAAWPTEQVPASTWGAVAFLGVVCTAAAFLVFFALIAEVGPTRMTVITYVNPAVAVALGIAVLAEPLTLGILVGFPLVLLGSYLATRAAPPMEDEPVPA